MTRKSIGKLHSDNGSKRNRLRGLRWLQPIVTGACFLLANVQIAELGIGTTRAEAGEKSELPKSTLVSPDVNSITQAEFDRLSLCQTRVLSYCNSIAGTNSQEFALELIAELTTLDDDDLAAVKYLPQMTSFDLLSVNTNEAALRHLKGLAQIKSLKIRDPEVSGKELAELVRSLPNLELIEIGWFFHAERLWRWPGSRLRDDFISACASRPKLRVANLGGVECQHGGLDQLAKLKTLKSLNLSSTGIDDFGLKALQAVTSLEELGLLSESYQDEDRFREVAIERDWTDAGTKHLYGLKNLKELSFHNRNLTSQSLVGIEKLHKLKVFYAPIETGDFGLAQIAKSEALEVLNLNLCMSITDNGLAEVAKIKTLTELSLRRTLVTNKGIHHLAMLPKLRFLNFGYCPNIDTKVLADLEAFPALEGIWDRLGENYRETDQERASRRKIKQRHELLKHTPHESIQGW